MNQINKDASPSTKLDFIFSHICNYKNASTGISNNVGGITFELAPCYSFMDQSFFGLHSKEEMKFYLDVLTRLKLIEQVGSGNTNVPNNHTQVTFPTHAKITFEGLKHLYDIDNKGVLSNKCFVAMIFDKNKDKRLDSINKACLKFGFSAISVEEHYLKGNYTIDAKIISAIKSSRFCIADFTGLNHGAYLEAGFAMGRDMKVIFISEENDFKENKKHFDVNHYPFICYTDFDDLAVKLNNEIGAYIAV